MPESTVPSTGKTLRTIFLIGLRGSGKTTVGRRLGEQLQLPFFDADAVLEQRQGRSIRDIFATDGEPRFRALEGSMLESLIAHGPAVIATGGGIVLRQINRERMRAAGTVVWLTADTATLWHRIRDDPGTATSRPKLSVGGQQELEDTLRIREPLYRACADLTVSTSGRSPEQIVADIVALWSTSS